LSDTGSGRHFERLEMSQSEGLLPLNSLQPASLVLQLKAEAERRDISNTAAVREALRGWLAQRRQGDTA
jgi:hypothetical protein